MSILVTFLREYSAALDAYPKYSLQAVFYNEIFSETYSSNGLFHYIDIIDLTEEKARGIVNELLCERLEGVVTSPRIRGIVMFWLVQGVSPKDTSKHVFISDKVIYAYRSIVMNALNIRHCSRELIASLKL